jgi:hypothetical protein
MMSRVRIQWATNPPGNWTTIDVTPTGAGAQAWGNQAKKAKPAGGETIDDQPGWVMAVEVDGVLFEGFDHYAVSPGSGQGRRVTVTGWNDDVGPPDDPETANYRWGQVWHFHQHRPDPRFRGQMNTHQIAAVYAEDTEHMAQFFPQSTSGGEVQLLPWSEFPFPPQPLVRHGVWVRDRSLHLEHLGSRDPVDWHDWN